MKPKKNISQLLEKYLNNELDPAEKELVDHLIESNEDTRAEFILRQKLGKSLTNTDLFELRARLKRIINQRNNSTHIKEPTPVYLNRFNAAATILILMGIGGLSFLYLTYPILTNTAIVEATDQNIQSGNEANNNPTYENPIGKILNQVLSNSKEKTDKLIEISDPEPNLYAHNFTKSPYLESFIDSYRSAEIKNISPKPGKEIGNYEQILFSWNDPDSINYNFTLFNNHETIIYKAQINNPFIYSGKLKPGLYYWRIEFKDDLVCMNKFIITKSN